MGAGQRAAGRQAHRSSTEKGSQSHGECPAKEVVVGVDGGG